MHNLLMKRAFTGKATRIVTDTCSPGMVTILSPPFSAICVSFETFKVAIPLFKMTLCSLVSGRSIFTHFGAEKRPLWVLHCGQSSKPFLLSNRCDSHLPSLHWDHTPSPTSLVIPSPLLCSSSREIQASMLIISNTNQFASFARGTRMSTWHRFWVMLVLGPWGGLVIVSGVVPVM